MKRNDKESDLWRAVTYVRRKFKKKPRVALVLGSGLGDFADELSEAESIDATDIPSYPSSSVTGHAGKLITGIIRDGVKQSPQLLLFKGRVHFYETGRIDPVILPIRLAYALSAPSLLLTNAAGAVNASFAPGQLMLIRDFFSLTFLPLPTLSRSADGSDATISRFRSGLGAGNPFDTGLQDIIRSSAQRRRITLQEGTYCWLKGPTYETAAEIRMLGKIGADAVGMSTVPEIVSAAQLGMRVAALSLISNLGTGLGKGKLSHAEVTETAQRVKADFSALLREVLLQLG